MANSLLQWYRGNAYYRAPMGIIEGELELKRKFLFEDKEYQTNI